VIAYLDSSVVLRLVLGEEHRLAEWDQVEAAVASALTEVECLRTLDRLARAGRLSPDELAERRGAVYQLLAAVDLIDVSRIVLRRASEPFPTPLGTLDAIHLSTALLWRETAGDPLTMTTHDRELATAARATGFAVAGA
jgi:predicted nucleic acid-binding protein